MSDSGYVIDPKEWKPKHKMLDRKTLEGLNVKRLRVVLKAARIDLKRAEVIGHCRCCDDFLINHHPRDRADVERFIIEVYNNHNAYFKLVKEILEKKENE